MKDDWISVSSADPCDVCGKPDNCKRLRDRSKIWCGRVSDGSIRQNNGGQFLHFLDNRPDSTAWLKNNPKPANTPKNEPDRQPSRDWGKFALDAFNHLNAGFAREQLSKSLGVSIDSIERLGVGWLGRVRGYTMPERDATGKVIGINRRLLNGEKRRERGGNAGLTFVPDSWLDHDHADASDVHLVEGFSDVAVTLSMGLSAVGRPSNLGGVEMLGELLKSVPANRRILVVGERDQKPHESLPAARQQQHKANCECCSLCWPDKFGAIRTAERLAAILNRVVSWTLTPEGYKDVRAWSNEQDRIEGKAEN